MHGLSGFTDEQVGASFRKAFNDEKEKHPNYGKAVGMDATQWWANVIRSTFSAVLPSSATVSEALIGSLFHRFSSDEGYQLYDDVVPFFRRLQNWRDSMGAPPPKELAHLQVHVGVVSNSDLRVPAILRSLGVQVAGRRYGSVVAIDPEGTCDIDSVTMSYDVGVEKPHKMIFGAARSLSGFAAKTDCLCLHVGDDIKDDYGGAHEAGWQSFLLDRDGKHDGRIPEANRLRDLGALMQKLTDAE